MNHHEAEAKGPTFRENVEFLRHFRNQFVELSNEGTLKLLSASNLEPFTGRDAMFVFKASRQAVSKRISKLVRLGLIERRGNGYTVTTDGRRLVDSLGRALRSFSSGDKLVRADARDDAALKELFELASEGLELLYSKGRIEQSEYSRRRRSLSEIGSRLNTPQ